jgi:predicted Ser/Thr protein kinase
MFQALKIRRESSPKPAAVGKCHFNALKIQNNWVKLQGQGPPVLLSQDYAAVQTLHNESAVVQYLTPYLQKLVMEAEKGLGKPLKLVNSENHPWIRTIGDKKKPDMFIAHPAVYKLNKSPADAKYDGENFLFGAPGSHDLRDMMEVPIIEAKPKIGNQDFQAFGEAIDYMSCLSVLGEVDGVPEDEERILSSKGMLIASNGFWLIKFESAIPIHCLHGVWTDPGSAQAIVDFIQYKRPDLERVWEDAISHMISIFEVDLIEPDYEGELSSFLGMGADGRVFRVCDPKDKMQYAMKCVASDKGFKSLRQEYMFHELYGERLSKSKSAAKLHKSYFHDKNKIAGLLFTPVGEELPETKYAMESAVEGLRLLCSAGVRHNDTRLPNVVWMKNDRKAVWVDFQRSFGIDSKLQGELYFVQSLEVFAESCNAGIEIADPCFSSAASKYYRDGDFKAISSYLRSFWSRDQSM